MYMNLKKSEELQEREERLDLVEPVLDVLLTKSIDDENSLHKNLVKLHGRRMANDLFDLVKDYVVDDSFQPGELRSHDVTAPSKIRDSKEKLSKNEHYKEAHKALLQGKIPGEQEMLALYGHHAESAKKSDELLLSSGRFRKCWTPIATHPNRVSAMVGELGFDDKVYDHDPFHFRFLAKIHDTPEEVIGTVRDEKGRLYGLDRFNDLLDDLGVAQEIRDHLVDITNTSDLIFRAMLSGEYNFSIAKHRSKITRDDVYNSLEILSGLNYDFFSDHALKIRFFLEDKDLPQGKVWETAKWLSYFGVYMDGLVDNALYDKLKTKSFNESRSSVSASNLSDFRTVEVKQVDVRENNLNKAALNIEDHIKNLIKEEYAGRKPLSLNSGWKPLIDNSRELIQGSYSDGLQLAKITLATKNDALDHFSVGLKYIKALQSVFYEDTPPANIYLVINS